MQKDMPRIPEGPTSLRLMARSGRLPRAHHIESQDELAAREPDDLFSPLTDQENDVETDREPVR